VLDLARSFDPFRSIASTIRLKRSKHLTQTSPFVVDAITIFLNSPNEYEGGELIIQSLNGEQSIKYPAGDAVLYPATTRHQVTPVTSGERLVAVTWVQSLIRNHEQRDLLYQLSKTREKMLRKEPDSEDTKRIDNVYVNLVRMWSSV